MSKSFNSILRWTTTPLLSLALYWPALTAWFQKDDFAWLGLYGMTHNWQDFWNVMFHPYAQGTVRTLSERVFFTGLYSIFGLNAFPYHLIPFATHIANLTLINAIAAKLTKSPTAGLWAALIWTLNANLAIPLVWSAIFYELLCALVFLSAFWLLMRYAETGTLRYLTAQWIVYLAGFLVLEQNIVYPALALVYALTSARHVTKKIYPMFIPAALYALIHVVAAPLAQTGPYQMHWDASIFPTLWMYWKITLGPTKLINLGIHPSLGRSALATGLTLGLLAWLLWQLRQKNWKAIIGPAWFLIVLAPLLPLKDHLSDYYLTIPVAGLALWGAMALTDANTHVRTTAYALFIAYAAVNIPLANLNVNVLTTQSHKIESLIDGVVAQSHLHPGSPIVLTGVAPEMFWSALVHRPFRLYGLDDVHIASTNRQSLGATGPEVDEFFTDNFPANARLLDVSGNQVLDVTPESIASQRPSTLPNRLMFFPRPADLSD